MRRPIFFFSFLVSLLNVGFVAAQVEVTYVTPDKVTPYSGASYTYDDGVSPPLPNGKDDENEVTFSVQQLLPSFANTKTSKACELGDQAEKGKCLSMPGRECMWTKLSTRNPLLVVQEEVSYCLPCEIDGNEVPCWRPNSWVDGKQVMECEMKCKHQKKHRLPEHACSDETGFISGAQCLDRGNRTKSKCMHVVFDNGKSTCAPCFVTGVGGIGCPAVGEVGLGGAKVNSCFSQCDVMCTTGPPDCAIPIVPPPLPIPPSPGIPRTFLNDQTEMVNAPLGIAPIPPNPYATAIAAQKAAQAAGWATATTTMAPIYTPVMVYRNPQDYAVTFPYPPAAFLEEKSAIKTQANAANGSNVGEQEADAGSVSLEPIPEHVVKNAMKKKKRIVRNRLGAKR